MVVNCFCQADTKPFHRHQIQLLSPVCLLVQLVALDYLCQLEFTKSSILHLWTTLSLSTALPVTHRTKTRSWASCKRGERDFSGDYYTNGEEKTKEEEEL